ncbi:hypothetical protein F5Y12DRAFT_709326 [Xylaria sp. FL1777]|nr:hypothetical protein F5Y12DRAFT_709326 [Xylaria sp. FL1777]
MSPVTESKKVRACRGEGIASAVNVVDPLILMAIIITAAGITLFRESERFKRLGFRIHYVVAHDAICRYRHLGAPGQMLATRCSDAVLSNKCAPESMAVT